MDRSPSADGQIDLTPSINHPDSLANIQLTTVLPDRPVHRGTHRQTYAALHAPPIKNSSDYELVSGEGYGYGPTDAGRAATGREKKTSKAFEKWRISKGLPAWTKMKDPAVDEFWETQGKGKDRASENEQIALAADEDAVDIERDAEPTAEASARAELPALKAWCEAFCSSDGMLKELRMNKALYGWDLAELDAGESAPRPV